MVRWKPLVYNKKDYVGVGEYLFALEATIDENQH
jgi:hypothetical protein